MLFIPPRTKKIMSLKFVVPSSMVVQGETASDME